MIVAICSISVLVGVLALVWRSKGPRRAIGVVTLLSLLVPTWVSANLGTEIPVTVFVGVCALGAYCVHPQARFKTPLLVIDWAVIGLIVVHFCVDWSIQGVGVLVPLRAYGEWFVPYVAGRLAVHTSEDVRGLVPVAVGVILVFAVSSALQGITGLNVFEVVFGGGQIDEGIDNARRWGMYRAYGPMKNPNYFGMAQVLLLAWGVYAAALSRRHRAPGWWMLVPVATVFGAVFPMSRAAQGGVILAGVLAWVVTWKGRWTGAVTIGAILLGIVLALSSPLVDAVDAWGGDLSGWTGTARQRTVVVDGEEKRLTGTRMRLYYFSLYRTAIVRAGLVGFGTEAVTGFPVNVPVGQQDLQTLKRMWTVDNAFLLMDLRFGLLGVLMFALWCGGVAWTWIRLLFDEVGGVELKGFLAAMAGVSLVMPLALMTIWMPQDFGFVYLWTGGLGAGLYAGERQRRVRAKPATTTPTRSGRGSR